MRARLATVLVALATLGLGACERAEYRGAETNATVLTVYVSLPFQGVEGAESTATADGARLALSRAGGKAGGLVVKLAVLDDSRTSSERWDPEQAADNARVAIRDRTAIAYLGDGPSGATAISLPLLNAGGIAQISPSSGYLGLTQAAGKGEPEKYYPTGVRSFARTIPVDTVQARRMLGLLRARGCRRLQIVSDGDIDGQGLAARVTGGLGGGLVSTGAPVVLRADAEFDPAAEAVAIRRQRPDCVLVTAGTALRFGPLLDALHAADPALALFATDGLTTPEVLQGLDAGTQKALRVTAPGGPLAPKGQRIARAYRAAFGRPPRMSSFYGYEAMELALAAIRQAGAQGANRAAVRGALFALGRREGPFGAYRIGPQGDTSDRSYGAYAVRAGQLVAPASGG